MHHRFPQVLPRITISLILSLTSFAQSDETLPNGIVLPDEWPPRIEQLSREPMKVPYLEHRPEMIPIDLGRQLFVDDFLIEQTDLTRTHYSARYHPTCPVLKPDKPWENDSMKGKPRKATAIVFGDGVWYDPTDELFKMWYMGSNLKRTCYATSKDGIQWEKPSLDIVPGTNILLDQERARAPCGSTITKRIRPGDTRCSLPCLGPKVTGSSRRSITQPTASTGENP